MVTGRFPWLTSWFPFSLIAPLHDLEQVIAFRSISSVRQVRLFVGLTYVVTFPSNEGEPHSLRLARKNPKAFVRSPGITIE